MRSILTFHSFGIRASGSLSWRQVLASQRAVSAQRRSPEDGRTGPSIAGAAIGIGGAVGEPGDPVGEPGSCFDDNGLAGPNNAPRPHWRFGPRWHTFGNARFTSAPSP